MNSIASKIVEPFVVDSILFLVRIEIVNIQFKEKK